MTSTDTTTDAPINTLLLHRLEHELDEACARLPTTTDSEEDTDTAVAGLATVVHRIGKVQPRTLGDVRIRAKALDLWYGGNVDAGVFDLLMVLQDLPERLWNEKIGPVGPT